MSLSCPTDTLIGVSEPRQMPASPPDFASDLILPFGERDNGSFNILIPGEGLPALRRIPPPRDLESARDRGTAAEDATEKAGSLWGLPDFLFRSEIDRKGSKGVREVGDRIFIVGSLGAVVQVKSRKRLAGDLPRERSWLAKSIKKAFSQGAGSLRRIHSAPVGVRNERGTVRQIQGDGLAWIAVTVIDHSLPPDFLPVVPENGVAILRRDWDFLFDQLKSSSAVMAYLHRVAGDSVTLGSEPSRYFEFAEADLVADPVRLDAEMTIPNSPQISAPILPKKPVGHEDPAAVAIYRSVLEDVAVLSRHSPPEDHFEVLSELDGLPYYPRGLVGKFLCERTDAWLEQSEGVWWDFKRIDAGKGCQVAFGVCSAQHSKLIGKAFSAWTMLRHHEHSCRFEKPSVSPVTVAVLLTPRVRDDRRPWDLTLCAHKGQSILDNGDLDALTEVWRRETEILERASVGNSGLALDALWLPNHFEDEPTLVS